MAKETVEAIKNAEKKSSEINNQAIKDSRKIIADANEKAAQIVDEARKAAQALYADEMEKAKSEVEKIAAQSQDETVAAAEDLRRIAGKKQHDVTRAIINHVFG